MTLGSVWQSDAVDAPHTPRAAWLLVAVAVGDALGWPHERRARRQPVTNGEGSPTPFVRWERRAGNRFRSLQEIIEPGEYSDDTQMAIAVARARLAYHEDWLSYFRNIELPFFLDYERGAGATVRRACKYWEAGKSPWEGASSADQGQYFRSGANGAAMRVAPHVIAHMRDRTFDALANDIAGDAISTHGHPRAILGAILHGFGHWVSLSCPSPIPYGWLLNHLLATESQWSKVPQSLLLEEDWIELADKSVGSFQKLWEATVGEIRGMLERAQRGISSGSLETPVDVLTDLGAASSKETGSGTICAVAAAYLATYNAADPQVGVQTAAILNGADTDTLASMTASLLTAAVGGEWLARYRRDLQDARYLHRLAVDLVESDKQLPLSTSIPTRGELSELRMRLRLAGEGTKVEVPGGRTGRVQRVIDLPTAKGNATRTDIFADDGQTFSVLTWPTTAGATGPLDRSSESSPARSSRPVASDPTGLIFGVEIFVRDLSKARRVIEEIAGIRADASNSHWARYGPVTLRENWTSPAHVGHIVLRATVPSLNTVVQSAIRSKVRIESPEERVDQILLIVDSAVSVAVREAAITSRTDLPKSG